MADYITPQDLQNAHTDAKTLEQAVNGAPDTIVTARLGASYPTLSTVKRIVDTLQTEKTTAINNLNAAINTAAAAGAGANGWTATLVKDASGKTQQQLNETFFNSLNSVDSYSDPQTAVNQSDSKDIVLSARAYNAPMTLNKANVVGTGYATKLKAAANSFALKAKQNLPNWDRTKITNLSIDGESINNNVGLLFDPSDCVAGRRNVSYVSFSNLDKAIFKPTGNIGNVFSNLNISKCNYAIKALSSVTPLMHCGNDTWRDFQFDNINIWAFDYDNSVDGGGAILLQDGIIEYCKGGGIRLNFHNFMPFVAPRISNIWFEDVATAATVNRDGTNEQPREIKLIDTPMCVIENCYLKNMELINSTAIAINCRVDNAATGFSSFAIDEKSTLIVEHAFMNGSVGGNVFIKSIAKQLRAANGTDLTLRGYDVAAIVKQPTNSLAAVGKPFCGNPELKNWKINGSYSMTAFCVQDEKGGACAQITLSSDCTNVLGFVPVKGGTWAVWGISTRVMDGNVAGTFDFAYDITTLGTIRLGTGEWTHSFGVAKIMTDGSVTAKFVPSKNGGVLRFKNYFIATFATETEAIAFANLRCAIDTTSSYIQAPYDPPSLAANAIQTTTVNVSEARIGDIVTVSFNRALLGTHMWAEVTADNTVTIYHHNPTTAPVDVVAGILTVKII